MAGIIAGLLIAAGIFFATTAIGMRISPLGKRVMVVAGLAREEEKKEEFGSLAFKLRMLGVSVKEETAKRTYYVMLGGTAAVVALAASILGLPPLGALAGGGAAAFLLRSYIDGQVERYRRKVEKSLPQALAAMSSAVHIQASIPETLKDVSRTLGEKNELGRIFESFAFRLQQEGPQAWPAIVEEASVLSRHLGIVMFALSRAAQRGGAEFSRAFADLSERISLVLAAQEDAHAKGQSAMTAVKVIAGIMLALVTFLAVDPVYRPAVMSGPGQAAIALAIVMMAVGYWYCTDKIKSTVQ